MSVGIERKVVRYLWKIASVVDGRLAVEVVTDMWGLSR